MDYEDTANKWLNELNLLIADLSAEAVESASVSCYGNAVGISMIALSSMLAGQLDWLREQDADSHKTASIAVMELLSQSLSIQQQ